MILELDVDLSLPGLQQTIPSFPLIKSKSFGRRTFAIILENMRAVFHRFNFRGVDADTKSNKPDLNNNVIFWKTIK